MLITRTLLILLLIPLLLLGQSSNSEKLKVLKKHISEHYFTKSTDLKTEFNQAIEIAKELNSDLDLADLYKMQGTTYYFNSQYDKALMSYTMALKLYEKKNNKKGIAGIYNEIGVLYTKDKNYSEALQNLENAKKIAYEIKDTSSICASLNNAGIVYEYTLKFDLALENYNQAINMYEMINDEVGLSYGYENIGAIYLLQKKYNSAIELFNKSLALRKKNKLEQGITISYFYLAETYKELKENNTSRNYYDSSLNKAISIQYTDYIQKNYQALSYLYLIQKDYKMAFEFQIQATKIKDSLLNEQKIKQLSEWQTIYEVERKTSENELLKKTNELNAQKVKNKNFVLLIVSLIFIISFVLAWLFYKNKQHKTAIDTKNKIHLAEQIQREKISHDLHDNVGAQLSYIVSNLDLIDSNEIKNDWIEKRIKSINEMSKQAIVTLRETVWALNNKSISIEQFADKYKSYVIKMSDYIENVAIQFKENIEHDEVLEPNDALHLFRICQEALNNSLKHSNASEINIEFLTNSEYKFIFKLKDNGHGFDEIQAQKKGHYGLQNMKERAKQLGAEFNILTTLGSGTSVEIFIFNQKNTTNE